MFERLTLNLAAHRQSYRKMLVPSIIYMTIYVIWWGLLEHRQVSRYTVIHMAVDDAIPFLEIFVIPYMVWFVYVVGVVLFVLVMEQKRDYYRLITFLYVGMTVFLIVSTLQPNIHELRPESFARSNLFTALVRGFYRVDTPTNLWPSIHVYNAIGAHIAVMESDFFRTRHLPRRLSLLTCVLIILSTVFIKQHSVFDVLTAVAMSIILYLIVYQLGEVAYEKRRAKD